jgi:uncharacterized linocin/CFP29 family protein
MEREMMDENMIGNNMMNMTSLGRDRLSWSESIWNRIDKAMHEECQRTKVASKFIPLSGHMRDVATVQSDTVEVTQGIVMQEQVLEAPRLFVEQTRTTGLNEIFVEFTLTQEQVDKEEEWMTAVTLATRGANLLSQAEDLLIFQGENAMEERTLFTEQKVQHRDGPAGTGLLNAPRIEEQIIPVHAFSPEQLQDAEPPLRPGELRFGERTFGAVADGYSRLQNGTNLAQAHYGPYALVLRTEPHADTYSPLPVTLIMPADRIKPLVMAGFYGTGTLPPLRGLLVSLGGNTMDLIMGVDAVTEFLQVDPGRLYRFRVYERFALRLKDPSSIIELDFIPYVGFTSGGTYGGYAEKKSTKGTK